MLFGPVLGIPHHAGLEAGQGAWRGVFKALVRRVAFFPALSEETGTDGQ